MEERCFLEKGWSRTSQKPLPTFTTSRPSSKPLRRPAGLKDCNEEELQRWKEHSHRFPPYQYMHQHCLQDGKGSLRTPSVQEREAIMGFPPTTLFNACEKNTMEPLPMKIVDELGGKLLGGGSSCLAPAAVA